MVPQGQYPPGQHSARYGPQLHVHAQSRGMEAGRVMLVIVGSIGMLMFGTCMVCTVMVGAGA
jgi:hypothetical protein